MKLPLLLTTLLALSPLTAQQPRPPITGISHMAVYSADLAASEHFYASILKAQKAADPEDPQGVRYYFSPTQFVEVLPLPSGQGISRLAHLAFNTSNAEALHAYMAAHQVPGLTAVTSTTGDAHRSSYFFATDPEGNRIEFVQPASSTTENASGGPISTRIIHVGMLVHSKPAEDAFYHDLLGFRPYWYGAMQPGKVDWISQQTPDGADWLEYMMVGDGSTTPLDHVNPRELGVLNHLSLGVPNMEQTVTTLYREDRLPPRHDGPQMGKDGKWQANFYDPDGTRVEFMEFQPVMDPCCSAFTAKSPAN